MKSQQNETNMQLQVKICSGDEFVDMEYSLETLKGYSGAITTIAGAIVEKKVPEKLNPADGVRAKLRGAYIGSYIQDFELAITDKQKIIDFNEIGKEVFSEVIAYFLHVACYLEPPQLSVKAENILKDLEGIEDEILEKISPRVKQMNKISKMNGYPVILSCISTVDGETKEIVKIDRITAENLYNPKCDSDFSNIEVIITRYNSFTGSGRLLVEGETKTTPFKFEGQYAKISSGFKKKLAKNLGNNTAKEEDEWDYLSLVVKAIRNKSGKVIIYLIHRVE